jgi:hypothetical protein
MEDLLDDYAEYSLLTINEFKDMKGGGYVDALKMNIGTDLQEFPKYPNIIDLANPLF